MNLFSSLRDRQLNGGRARPPLPFLQDFNCEQGECSGTIVTNAGAARHSPVFALKYSSVYEKLLAMGDEDGYVSVVNTATPPPETLDDASSARRACAQWTAHRNAIFDIAWANADAWVYTASGDMTIAAWDTAYANPLARFRGHSGSVKALAVHPSVPDVIASGARDGKLMLWDGRTPAVPSPLHSSEAHAPVAQLTDPHRRETSGRRARRVIHGPNAPSVTALQFLTCGSGHMLASGGVDGVVKFWDVRNVSSAVCSLPGMPCPRSYPADTGSTGLVRLADGAVPRLGDRDYAVTSLALHPDGSQLLVSLTGGHHLLYNSARPEAGPRCWYGGHSVSSFYIKAAFSPDGSHFVSGSSDACAYIWQVDGADGAAPYVLRGHEKEVTTAAWCPTDFCQLATAGDDCTVKVWNVARQQLPEVRDPPARRGAALARALAGAPHVPHGSASCGREQRDQALRPLPIDAGTPMPDATIHAQTLARSTGGCSASSSRGAAGATAPRTMRISNALRAGGDGKRKRLKQPTLEQALGAARAAAALQAGRNDGGRPSAGQAKRNKSGTLCSPGAPAEVRRPTSISSNDENVPAP